MAGRIEITPVACFAGALMILILPLRWVLAAVLAAAVHEIWHWAAIRLCGGVVYSIKIGAGGAIMETEPQRGWRELICAAAGPVGSFSMLLGAKYFPAAALCGLAQGLFNLLPLFPLDGGRLLRCALEMLFPRISGRTIRNLEVWMFLLAAAAGIYGAFRLGIGCLGLICAAVLLTRLFPVKNTLQRIRTGGTIEIH